MVGNGEEDGEGIGWDGDGGCIKERRLELGDRVRNVPGRRCQGIWVGQVEGLVSVDVGERRR